MMQEKGTEIRYSFPRLTHGLKHKRNHLQLSEKMSSNCFYSVNHPEAIYDSTVTLQESVSTTHIVHRFIR